MWKRKPSWAQRSRQIRWRETATSTACRETLPWSHLCSVGASCAGHCFAGRVGLWVANRWWLPGGRLRGRSTLSRIVVDHRGRWIHGRSLVGRGDRTGHEPLSIFLLVSLLSTALHNRNSWSRGKEDEVEKMEWTAWKKTHRRHIVKVRSWLYY